MKRTMRTRSRIGPRLIAVGVPRQLPRGSRCEDDPYYQKKLDHRDEHIAEGAKYQEASIAIEGKRTQQNTRFTLHSTTTLTIPIIYI